MKMMSLIRYGAAAGGLCGVAALGLMSAAPSAQGQSSLIQDGKLGFVVADISFGLSNADDPAAMCPNGTTVGPGDVFEASPEGQRREGESDADYTRRRFAGSQTVMTAPNGENLCMNPEAGAPDPNHHPVSGDVAVYGIDLDGQASRANGRAAPGTCAHDDFRGVSGGRNVDNQFFRAVGCMNTFQPGGQANTFAEFGMLVGEWGILIGLEDVQDLRNDNDVTVRIYANADPIQLSPTREPLINATYAFEQDERYQATTRGRIANGVLTTEPFNARFHWVVNSIRLDRPLRDARLRMTINEDGSMEGFMAGYSPVDEIYDAIFGFRNGRDGAGELAPLRLRQISSNGYAATARHTCHGAYYALHEMADGHRDPATGNCTSLSTQYRVRAIPAFIVEAETESLNEGLDPTRTR